MDTPLYTIATHCNTTAIFNLASMFLYISSFSDSRSLAFLTSLAKLFNIEVISSLFRLDSRKRSAFLTEFAKIRKL